MPFFDVRELVAFSPEKYQKNNFWNVPQMVGDVYCLEPGQQQNPHRHADEAKIYYVLQGRGDFTVGDEVRTLGPGQVACAGSGVEHGVANLGSERLVLLVVIAPNPSLRNQ